MKVTKAQKEDYQRFYVKNPKSFSAARNKAIIEQSIADYEALRAKKLKDRVAQYEERADAVAMYLRHIDRSSSGKPMEKYFGKRELARLRGQEIMEELMSRLKIVGKGS